MQIIVINGYPNSGKDLFIKYCEEIVGQAFIKNISTVDFVKYIAALSSWDGTKTPKNRKFLSDLKKLLIDWNDIPYKKVETEIKCWYDELANYGLEDKGFVFIHCREPLEIEKFVDRMGAKTLFIKRDIEKNTDETNSNDSDRFVEGYDYEFYIDNNSTKEHLKYLARDFIYNLQDLEKRDIIKERLKERGE